MTASLNPYISHFGEEFDAEKSSQYRMAIQFSLGGLSYALLDTHSNRIIALECYLSDLLSDSDDLFRTLERALESKGLNGKDFLSVTGLYDNRICTLVPEPLFNEAQQAKYLDFSFQIPENYAVAAESIEKCACYNVFAYPKTLHDKMLAKWKDAQFKHTSSIHLSKVMKDANESYVSVMVRNRDFDTAIKKNGKLLFFNNFKFNTKEDFAYFLLFAMEQNNISGTDTLVRFSGLIRPASEIIDLCGRYVKDIRFVEDPQVSKALDEVPFQYYYILYQALKQESARPQDKG